MKKIITLNKNREFNLLYRRGKCYVSSVLVTYVLKNNKNVKRYGVTTSKKIGKAVFRNRSKRVIKEAYFKLYDNISPGYDIVFVARGRTPYVKMDIVYKKMKKQLKKAGVFKEKKSN